MSVKKYVYLVSYPRSGQHYMQRMIERVTGEDDYCELYHCRVKSCPGSNAPISERTPCQSGRKIQKTHDFDLNFPCQIESRYAVFIRNPLYSITSYYERETKNHGLVILKNGDGGNVSVKDTREAWLLFLKEKLIYWKEFAGKWHEKKGGNVKVFNYEKIVSTEEAVQDFFNFCFDEDYSDRVSCLMKKQKESLSRPDGHKLRSVSEFRYPICEATNIAREIIGDELLSVTGYLDELLELQSH